MLNCFAHIYPSWDLVGTMTHFVKTCRVCKVLQTYTCLKASLCVAPRLVLLPPCLDPSSRRQRRPVSSDWQRVLSPNCRQTSLPLSAPSTGQWADGDWFVSTHTNPNKTRCVPQDQREAADSSSELLYRRTPWQMSALCVCFGYSCWWVLYGASWNELAYWHLLSTAGWFVAVNKVGLPILSETASAFQATLISEQLSQTITPGATRSTIPGQTAGAVPPQLMPQMFSV